MDVKMMPDDDIQITDLSWIRPGESVAWLNADLNDRELYISRGKIVSVNEDFTVVVKNASGTHHLPVASLRQDWPLKVTRWR